MKLFSDEELQVINKELLGKTGYFLIAFRNKHGPTLLKKLWTEMLEELGHTVKCLSWWSSAGRIGLLECDTENGLSVFGQWALDDKQELLNVMELDEDELGNIRDGFDAGTVTSSAMRAYRIGESGGEKE
ncbi:MAG: hypothetical protein ACXACG_04255 [Candidatus Thorarchaeota archaeon]|jgi:hypothetical protein